MAEGGEAVTVPQITMVYYRVLDHCEESFYHAELPVLEDMELLAESCAEDYHRRHDGWEASWPLTFALHDTEGGPELGRFVVDCCMEPSFSAVKARAEEAKP